MIKRSIVSMMALLAALVVAGPGGALAASKQSADAKASGTGASGTAGAAAKAPSKKLQEGLQKLHAANQAEIQGGKLAQQTATSSDVKSFGEKMVTDHTQNDQQLTSMAETMGVTLTGKEFTKEQKDAQKRMSKVEKKTGADFDKSYIQAMVQDHQKDSKDVKKLADEARKDGQTDLASFLDQTEQAMQGHLSMAKQIEQTVKNEKKSASSSSSSTGSSSK